MIPFTHINNLLFKPCLSLEAGSHYLLNLENLVNDRLHVCILFALQALSDAIDRVLDHQHPFTSLLLPHSATLPLETLLFYPLFRLQLLF